MAIEDLPGDFFTPTSDQVRDDYQRYYKLEKPDALIGEKTEPYARGAATAAIVMPLYANAQTLARTTDLDDATMPQLTEECVRIGIPTPFPAVGGGGFVKVSASAGGTTLFAGDECKTIDGTNLRYVCTRDGLYLDGAPVPIAGFDTGPQTNLAAGTELKWTNPRPGCNSRTTIIAQGNGVGLEGGRAAETEDEVANRIRSAKANPPAAGNEAEVRKFVTKTPGLPVQEVFVYAAPDGSGTTSFALTLAPAEAGASRAPTAAQIADARAYLIGQFPKDDGIIDLLVLEDAVNVIYKIDWAPKVRGWVDAVTWPPYHPSIAPAVLGIVDALNFTIDTATQPQSGQSFGFFDRVTRTFRRKRVLTSTINGGGGYDIVCDASNAASDESFVPAIGDIACPFSESLDLLVAETLRVFERVGPGELFAGFFDPGFRQRRDPPTTEIWFSTLTTRSFNDVSELSSVSNFEVVSPTLPLAATVGTPNVSVNMHALGRIAVFPYS